MKLPSIMLVSLTSVLTFGCAQTRSTTPAPKTTISCRVPNITPLPETAPSQEKGGVEITIVPVIYKATRHDKHRITPVAPNFTEALLGPPAEKRQFMTFIQEDFTTDLVPSPNRLQFAVRINNKLSRVFRGQGSVVQINVAGKLMPINREHYAEFVDGIVPPLNEVEVKIFGLSLDSIPENSTIGIFLYDVVTATDTAGNVTEKQNYTWYFKYQTTPAEDSYVPRTTRSWADNSAIERTRRQDK